MPMGFIRKLLTGVSSAALLLVGAAAQAADDPPPDTRRLKIVITPPSAELSNLMFEFVEGTGGTFKANRVEASIQRMFERMTVERLRELPKFARELRELRLDALAEVIAIETMLAKILELPRSVISEARATEITGQIFDEFVSGGPLLVTDPSGRTVDTSRGQSLFAPPVISFDPAGYQG